MGLLPGRMLCCPAGFPLRRRVSGMGGMAGSWPLAVIMTALHSARLLTACSGGLCRTALVSVGEGTLDRTCYRAYVGQILSL